MLHNIIEKIKQEIPAFEAEEILKYENAVNHIHVCPCCGSMEVVRNGTYERNIIFIRKDRLVVKRIRMQRYLCKKCSKTRTYYPVFVVPKREYSMGTILFILLTQKRKAELLEGLEIPESQIRELKRRFRISANKLRHIMRNTDELSLKMLLERYSMEYRERLLGAINGMCT